MIFARLRERLPVPSGGLKKQMCPMRWPRVKGQRNSNWGIEGAFVPGLLLTGYHRCATRGTCFISVLLFYLQIGYTLNM